MTQEESQAYGTAFELLGFGSSKQAEVPTTGV